MTDVGFALLEAEDELLIDGGFAANPLYAGLLAALRPGQPVRVNRAQEGTATGASLLASWDDPKATVPLVLEPCPADANEGLQTYAAEWRRRAEQSG
jgi:sugar (pentulose or hexulose) kinase